MRLTRCAVLLGTILGAHGMAGAEDFKPGKTLPQWMQAGEDANDSGGAGNSPAGTEMVSVPRAQLEALQEELRRLRGVVEEQTYRVTRMSQEQRDRYEQIDQRLSALSQRIEALQQFLAVSDIQGGLGQGEPAPGGAMSGADESADDASDDNASDDDASDDVTSQGGASADDVPPEDEAANFPPASEQLPTSQAGAAPIERDAYARALELVESARGEDIWQRERLYQQAIEHFEALLADYPNGPHTPDAHYWIGDLRLATEQPELARQSLMQIVNLYPDHPKVANALYKLGLAYRQLNDRRRAAEHFNRVLTEHPDTTAAMLAQEALAELR